MAVTDRDKGNKGITAFIVELDNPGIRPGKKENKLGHARLGHLHAGDGGLPGSRRRTCSASSATASSTR